MGWNVRIHLVGSVTSSVVRCGGTRCLQILQASALGFIHTLMGALHGARNAPRCRRASCSCCRTPSGAGGGRRRPVWGVWFVGWEWWVLVTRTYTRTQAGGSLVFFLWVAVGSTWVRCVCLRAYLGDVGHEVVGDAGGVLADAPAVLFVLGVGRVSWWRWNKAAMIKRSRSQQPSIPTTRHTRASTHLSCAPTGLKYRRTTTFQLLPSGDRWKSCWWVWLGDSFRWDA